MAMITLHVEQLTKSFGAKTVFSDVSFEHSSRSLGISGANGSGKSTFLKCLASLLRPTAGSIKWQKKGSFLPKEQIKKRLGFVAPYINLYDELNCYENLRFLATLRHEKDSDNHIEEWIRKVELAQVANQPFGSLSTGQQQRLRLASALFHQPSILLLDEPGSNLDEAGQNIIAEIVETFNTDDKMLILASNNTAELNLCETIFSIEAESFRDTG